MILPNSRLSNAIFAVAISFSCGCDKHEPSAKTATGEPSSLAAAPTSQSSGPVTAASTEFDPNDPREILRRELSETGAIRVNSHNTLTAYGSRLEPEIVDSELIVRDGSVTITLQLENEGETAVFYPSFHGQFYAGVQYEHLGGEEFVVEGDERKIRLWTGLVTLDNIDTVNVLGPGETRTETISLEVPVDMPNPVEVSAWAQGPLVESARMLGIYKYLRWRTDTAPESADPDSRSYTSP